MHNLLFPIDAQYRTRSVAVQLGSSNEHCQSNGGFTLYRCGSYYFYAPIGVYPVWQGTNRIVQGVPLARYYLSGKNITFHTFLPEENITDANLIGVLDDLNAVERWVMEASIVLPAADITPRQRLRGVYATGVR